MVRLAKTARNTLLPNQLHKLSDGKHADGGGLYLFVRSNGASRRWYCNAGGKTHSIGGFPEISLSVARDEALKIKGSLALGIDLAPKEAKKHTLGSIAQTIHSNRIKGNAKADAQWLNDIRRGVPNLFDKNIADIDVLELETALLKVLHKTPVSGRRLRQRLGVVWDKAVLMGLVSLNLPDALKKTLEQGTPKVKKGHHAALDWRKAPAFYQWLAQDKLSMGRLALRYTMLTGARTQEALLAKWSEIDGKIRAVPELTMKMKREHLVYLAPETLKVLKLAKAHPHAAKGYVFQSPRYGDKPLSNMAMAELLKDRDKKLFKDHFTVHGMRATFKTWAKENNISRDEVIEACLAHFKNDAYDRSQYAAEREQLLTKWAKYLAG